MPTCDLDPDGHARRVLEFPKLTTLLADRASTDGGRQLLAALTPSVIPEEIRERQSRARELRFLVDAGAAPPSLHAVADFRGALVHGRPGTAALAALELRSIADTLQTASRVRRWLEAQQGQLLAVCSYLGEWSEAHDVVQRIHKAILDTGEIDDAASARLRDLRSRQTTARKNLVRRLEKIASDQPRDGDSWVTLRGERYVIPVRTDAAATIPGIVHDRSASGVTLFVEPLEVVEGNNELQGLQDAERRECNRILQELTDAVLEHKGTALHALSALEKLDALMTAVLWGRDMRAATPAMADSIRLREARHPLLEMQLQGTSSSVVPLDIDLAVGQSLVITGPNTGGKTVAMKCLGLLVLMHQSGLQIPAHADSCLPVVTRLVADIGDEQSIEAAQSTFSSHLLHIGRAVCEARPGCLVLLDEFMSGTDPVDGSALAKAVLRTLVRRGAQALVTTHLGELKLFAHAEPGIANAAMLFDTDSRTPLYRLRAGVPGSSNALNIAARMGIAEDLIQEARDLRGADSGQLEDAIVALERERQALSEARQEASEAAQEGRRLREEYAERLKAIVAERKKHMGAARQEAASLVRDAQAQIENLVRELRETQASRETIHKARQTLDQLRDQVADDSPVGQAGEARNVEVGDTVYVRSLQRQARVEAVGRGGRLRVRFGNIQMQVDQGDVRVDGPASTSEGSAITREQRGASPGMDRLRGGHDIQAEEQVSLRLDVRGLDREEAVSTLDRFLDRAVLQGAPMIQIIHGKGTGVLRSGIQAYLADHPRVATYRLGEHGEGGSGVTIVHLD